ncbi:MAG: dihydropteroate synthase-like protein [Candidatus Bathyarchaeota archaeon]|nr:dihydropteroate synthase-like protein [Candidatus Bathyarchaeota archaeon]
MKVLLVTGLLAEETVKQYVKESSLQTTVIALKLPVAALLTPEGIVKELKTQKTQEYDVILVPGLIRGDATVITQATGTPAFKGPRYAADLPTVLDALTENIELSPVTPACDLLRSRLQKKALQELAQIEADHDRLLKEPANFSIGALAVGKSFPMRVLAEIVDAALMPDEELERLAVQFVSAGAHVVDVGMVSGGSRPEDAKRAVQAIKRAVDVPVSIDSLDPNEIKASVDAGAQLILSLDAGNVEQIAPFAKNVAVVAIPTNQREGIFPKTAHERVVFLEEIIAKAQKLGVKRILADLILEPSNVLESFVAYEEFARRNPEVPLFVGVSNVTELFDADSVGVNALLARLSAEVDASMLLATEKSVKAKGTVHEEAVAAQMMFLSKRRGSVPKDLGLDLLLLKEKRSREEPYNPAIEKTAHTTTADSMPALVEDPKGIFKIAVDRNAKTLIALHFPNSQTTTPTHVVKAKTAPNLYSKIAELGLLSRLDHAAYLGSEIAKAEIALKTGKSYVQDANLFDACP